MAPRRLARSGTGTAASFAARGSSSDASAEELDHDIASQWQVVLQLGVVFFAAFLWFRDGVRGVWVDVIDHEYWPVGPYLARHQLRPAAPAGWMMGGGGVTEEQRLPAVVTVAALHTALTLVGSVVGNTLKTFFTPLRAAAVGAVVHAAAAAGFYEFLRRGYADEQCGVRVIAAAMHWPVGVPSSGEHFAVIGTASLVSWFSVASALAAFDTLQGETASRGFAPASVARYVPLMTGFYVMSFSFFYFACVPMWNSWVRFSILMEAGTGVQVADADMISLSKLASATHTLALALGLALCALANVAVNRARLPAFPGRETALFAALVGGFGAAMSMWVRFAFANRVRHVLQFAEIFFGAGAVGAAAGPDAGWTSVHTLILSSYVVWFALGVVFEQSWVGSSTNVYPSSSQQDGGSGAGMSAGVYIVAVILVALPASWLTGTIGVFVFAALLWPAGPCANPPHNLRREATTPADAWRSVSWEDATRDCPRTGGTYLVIGVGFVGERLIHRLLERGETAVRAFDVTPRNPFDGDRRVTYIRGNVLSMDDLLRACDGVETVYATFAMIRFWERLAFQAPLSSRVNIDGTRNVIEACRRCKVKWLLQTSTSNVMVTPQLMRLDMDEESPYVKREQSHNHYSWTKAIAEQEVLEANGKEGLHTAAIRPCSGVFGPNDRTLCDRYMRLRVFVCPAPQSKIDYIYVDNVVLGHLKAEARIRETPEKIGGLAYNISNEEPVNMWSLLHAVETYYGAGYLRQVPAPYLLTHLMAAVIEAIHWTTSNRLMGIMNPDLAIATPATMATGTMTFTVKSGPGCRARELLNYKPAYTLDEAIAKTVHDWKIQHGVPVDKP